MFMNFTLSSPHRKRKRVAIIVMCTIYYTQYGETALMKAARCGYNEAVVELVKAKANLDLQNEVCDFS